MKVENLPKRLMAATNPGMKVGEPTATTSMLNGPSCGAAAGRSTWVTPTLRAYMSVIRGYLTWNAKAYTTMKTAVKMEANPIQVKMASLPRVRMLATKIVQMAATRVQTTVQT